MIKGLDPELWNTVINGTPAQRVFICEEEFSYFCFYYFNEYFTYPAAPFHWEFFDDCMSLVTGRLKDVAWIAFRESAKTSIAKMFVTWCIVYKKRKYIAWDSYDGANAESALFDISMALQTNKKIIRDFGRLYRKRKKQKTIEEQLEDAPEIKRMNMFITENKVKVEAFTTQESTRGRLTGNVRPDLWILDDIENSKTKESLALTGKIISHVDELNTGIGTTGSKLILGNYISEEGVIAYLMDLMEGKAGKVVRNIPLIKHGQITWPGKFVMTNREAIKLNEGRLPEEHVLSVEQKRADVGEKVFQTEFMNDPGKSGDYFFNREKVRAAMEKVKDPIKEVAGLKMWASFDARHRYGGGADTAEGIGGDSSTTCIIDFTQKPNQVVATYANNEIPPNTFAWEIVRHSREFGECYFIPEINNTGYATVAELINKGFYNMYVREVKNKTTDKLQKEYGWRTTQGSKHEVFSQFKTAFEDGDIEILDIRLLNEMYHFTKQNLRSLTKEEGMTRHFDLLTAAALAWEARIHATLSKEEKDSRYKAPKRDPYQV